MTEDLLESIRGIVGEAGLLPAEAAAARSVGVWDERPVLALGICRPASTEELAAVMRLCHASGQTVVTHGGRTGLVEGCVSTANDLVISLERMNRVEHVDVTQGCMIVQAGTPLEVAQQAAAATDFMLALDLGARGSCTIGGNIATNAGGNRVLRYGMTRDMVLGLEAVLADGTIISSMNRMLKNNAGFDLKQLFIGTEGSLGIVTRAVLRLYPAFRSESTALVACNDFAGAAALLKYLDRELGGYLSAFECMWPEFYARTAADPVLADSYGQYVLVESLGPDPEHDSEKFVSVLGDAMEQGLITDAAIAKSEAERKILWAQRDNVEACLHPGPAFIFDVSLSISDMAAYVEEVRSRLDKQWRGNDCYVFGHVGDGNLHFVISVGAAEARQQVEACVYEPLQQYGGSVSAEHGIGLEKKPWLGLSRSSAEVALMRQLKSALDPQALLNPGKVFDAAE